MVLLQMLDKLVEYLVQMYECSGRGHSKAPPQEEGGEVKQILALLK